MKKLDICRKILYNHAIQGGKRRCITAKQENFNALISSIQEALLQVNKLSEKQHLDILKNYFDEAGTLSYHAVSVPRLCLAPITSLKLNEVLVDFKVELYGKVQLKEATEKTSLKIC